MLQSTLSFVETCGSKGQVILFVATRQETVDLVNRTAQNLSLPFYAAPLDRRNAF